MAITLNGTTGVTTTGLTSNGIDDNATSTAMTLDTSGNVGIGTSSPSAPLTVDTGAGTFEVKAKGSGSVTLASDASLTYFGSTHEFYNAAGTTTHAVIDSSGNVGIGTSSPTADLHLGGTNPNLVFGTSGNELTYLQRYNDDFYIFNKETAGNILFGTANSERMRIDSSGNLLVGKNSGTSDYFLQLGGSSSKGSIRFDNAYSSQTVCLVNNSSNTNFNFAVFENGGSTKGNILVTTTGTAYITSSDYRLKTDAQPMTGASARVQALNPVNFEWIADGTRVDGFLAHEAQAVVPEAVTGTKDAMMDEEYEVTPAVYEDVVIPAVLDEDGNELEAERTEQQLVTEAVMGTRSVPDYQGIDQSKLVPLLTAALQEALTKIETMEARLTALEAV